MVPDPPVGELSQDHLWLWDGLRWVPTISPDGRWRWDGMGWAPNWNPTPGPGTSRSGVWVVGRLFLVATLMEGLLLLGAAALGWASQRQTLFAYAILLPLGAASVISTAEIGRALLRADAPSGEPL